MSTTGKNMPLYLQKHFQEELTCDIVTVRDSCLTWVAPLTKCLGSEKTTGMYDVEWYVFHIMQ